MSCKTRLPHTASILHCIGVLGLALRDDLTVGFGCIGHRCLGLVRTRLLRCPSPCRPCDRNGCCRRGRGDAWSIVGPFEQCPGLIAGHARVSFCEMHPLRRPPTDGGHLRRSACAPAAPACVGCQRTAAACGAPPAASAAPSAAAANGGGRQRRAVCSSCSTRRRRLSTDGDRLRRSACSSCSTRTWRLPRLAAACGALHADSAAPAFVGCQPSAAACDAPPAVPAAPTFSPASAGCPPSAAAARDALAAAFAAPASAGCQFDGSRLQHLG